MAKKKIEASKDEKIINTVDEKTVKEKKKTVAKKNETVKETAATAKPKTTVKKEVVKKKVDTVPEKVEAVKEVSKAPPKKTKTDTVKKEVVPKIETVAPEKIETIKEVSKAPPKKQKTDTVKEEVVPKIETVAPEKVEAVKEVPKAPPKKQKTDTVKEEVVPKIETVVPEKVEAVKEVLKTPPKKQKTDTVKKEVVPKIETVAPEKIKTIKEQIITPTVEQTSTVGMSKSAKRRAKKKAKKLLAQQLQTQQLQQQEQASQKQELSFAENSSNEKNISNEEKNTVKENKFIKKIVLFDEAKSPNTQNTVSEKVAEKVSEKNEKNTEKNVAQKINNQKQNSSNEKNNSQNKNQKQKQNKNQKLKSNDRRIGKKQRPDDAKPISNQSGELPETQANTEFPKSVKTAIPFVDLSKLNDKKRKVRFAKSDTEIVPIKPEKLLSVAERKDPFFQNFYREVEKFLLSEMLVESGSKVVVAVSGGVDSVVMFDVLANLSDKYRFAIYVAHYNHHLRGDASNQDEKFVKELAASYNVPYYWANGKVAQHAEKNGLSIEEAARFLRYFFFERTVRNLKADFIATAHTLEDSTETFLLNLLRGTGLTGLSGIPSRRQFIKDTILIRPFLNIRKQKILEYAEKRNLKWREDETNLEEKFTRNKIRLDLIPKLAKDYTPAITEVLNRSAKLIQGADRIIHDYVRTHLTSVVENIQSETVAIKVAFFKTFDEFIRGEMLQTVLMKYFRMMPPSMKIIDRILKLENSDVGAVCEISKSIFAVRDRQTIIITRKTTPNKIDEKIEKKGKYKFGNMQLILKEVAVSDIEYSDNPKVEFFDFDLIPQNLILRNWEHSDEFNPLGMSGTMKVSDFLTNEKIPILDKPNILVLATNSGEIIWICRQRISNKFKVTDKTKKVLRIEIKAR